jgi:hypothetical protein
MVIRLIRIKRDRHPYCGLLLSVTASRRIAYPRRLHSNHRRAPAPGLDLAQAIPMYLVEDGPLSSSRRFLILLIVGYSLLRTLV